MGFENAQLATLADIQQTYQLLIPEYQRGYAWNQNQWKDLWNDLVNVASRPSGDHYAGTLMFRPLGALPRDRESVEVVDGQQRLTTIALLLRALEQTGIAIEFQNNEPLQTYFDYFASPRPDLAPRLGQFVSFYGKNIEHAAGFFAEKVASLDATARQKLGDALLGRFKLFILTIKPGFDVHVAFETINNRGKPLTILEKLKNRLIYLSSIAPDAQAGQQAAAGIHQSWKGIYHWLGKGPSLLDDDEFLRVHSMGWFRHEKNAEWLNTQLFDEIFSSSNPCASPAYITTYVRSLETAAAWWFHLNHPDRLPPEVQRQLASFKRTAFASVRPLLLWSLIRLGSLDVRLASTPAQRSDWCAPFISLLQQAERFAVLVLTANARRSNTGQGDLNRSAYCLANPGTPLYLHSTARATHPADALGAVEFSRDHLKSLIDNWQAGDATKTYADDRFEWSGYFDPVKVHSAAADQLRSGNGFYGWGFGKLIIHEWEQRLRGDKGLPDKKPWDQFSWDQSVEHIYPQNPTVGDWSEAITFDGRTSEGLKNAVTNSLGNLLLLSGSRNASLSNRPYRGGAEPDKAKSLRYRAGSYSEWQVAHVCTDWNVAAIAARGIAMMRFAEKRWGFQLVDPQDKLTAWLPLLFGDHAASIKEGKASGGRAVDGRALTGLVERFETQRPG